MKGLSIFNSTTAIDINVNNVRVVGNFAGSPLTA